MKNPIKINSSIKSADVAHLRYEKRLEKWSERCEIRRAEAWARLEAVAEFRKLSLLKSHGLAYDLVTAMFSEKGLKISPRTIYRWNKAISARMDRSGALFRLSGPLARPPKKTK